MEWITANYQGVLAIVGGLFVFLRVIVLVTATPKDDQLLKKAEGFWMKLLGAASAGFGLDTTKGIPKKGDGPNIKPPITALVLCCFIFSLSGCFENLM